jgi:hypothetical protein
MQCWAPVRGIIRTAAVLHAGSGSVPAHAHTPQEGGNETEVFRGSVRLLPSMAAECMARTTQQQLALEKGALLQTLAGVALKSARGARMQPACSVLLLLVPATLPGSLLAPPADRPIHSA